MKPINGYPGQNDVLLAMERRELDGHPSAFYQRAHLDAADLAAGQDRQGDRAIRARESSPSSATCRSRPTSSGNADDRLVMEAAFAPLALGRPFLLPPDVPAERVAALRGAFAATMADPEFLAEGEKIGLGLNAPRTGAQIQEVMERAYRSPPAVIDRLRQLNTP